MDFIITSEQEVSEDIMRTIKTRGGLYDKNMIVEEFYSNLFNNVVIHFSHLSKLTMQRYYTGSNRTLKYGIINSGKIGGFACVGEKNIDFIGINSGTISMVATFFTKMMCNPNILPEIGDINLEKNAEQSYILGENNFEIVPLQQPVCRIRRLFAMHLVMTSLDFIFGHEITHIVNGHFGIINQVGTQNANYPQLFPLEKQALERDADYGAIETTLIYTEIVRGSRSEFNVEGDDPFAISWRNFYGIESDTIKYCFITSYITLRINAPDYWSPDSQLKIYQPLPPYRMALLMHAYCLVLSDFNEEQFEQSKSKVYEWCIESEQAYADLLADSGKGELDVDGISSFFIMGKNYNNKVNEAYSKLTNELANYEMQAVLPKKTSDYVVMKGLQRNIIFILEGKIDETNPKQINMLCFIKNENKVSGMPFPLWFQTEFKGDLINAALTSNGATHAVMTEGLTLSELEVIELTAIRNYTSLLDFALKNSNCLKLKREILQLQNEN